MSDTAGLPNNPEPTPPTPGGAPSSDPSTEAPAEGGGTPGSSQPGTPADGGATPAEGGETGTSPGTLLESTGDQGDTGGEKSGEGGEPLAAAPADWPDNWRQIMAGGDDKLLTKLNRFNSPVNLMKSWLAGNQKIGTGEFLRTKPDGSDEQGGEQAVNEWRAQAGVPERAEGYLEGMPKGLVVSEGDEALVASYTEAMHQADAPPGYVHQGIAWYYDLQETIAAERADMDAQGKAQSEDSLRAEWGPDYRPNLGAVVTLIDTHGAEGLKEKLFGARLSDGTPFGDDPDTIKFLSSVSRLIMPRGTITPNEGMTALETIRDEIKRLESESGDQQGPYWRGPEAEGKQARLRELYEMEESHRK